MGGWEPVPNGRTRLRVHKLVSTPYPGGPTRTTRWVDKATHLEGSVIALEVPESRYWVRSIFCLSRVRSHKPLGVCSPNVHYVHLIVYMCFNMLLLFLCLFKATQEGKSHPREHKKHARA